MRLASRRITAYLIDYGVILVWMGLLFMAASLGVLRFHSPELWTASDRWFAQGQAFLSLTLPIYLYFTVSEALGRKATLGKRQLGLQVEGSLPRIVLRNLIKFLPWEIAHTAIWHGMPIPMASEPTTLGLTFMSVSMVIAGLYIISLFVGSGRTPYDRISGTQVIRTPVTTH